eukprot:scaffold1136_cov399-Prasinococcus_capsulatus_cf.AAC.4
MSGGVEACFGVCFKDFALIAADRSQYQSIIVQKTDEDKVRSVVVRTQADGMLTPRAFTPRLCGSRPLDLGSRLASATDFCNSACGTGSSTR